MQRGMPELSRRYAAAHARTVAALAGVLATFCDAGRPGTGGHRRISWPS